MSATSRYLEKVVSLDEARARHNLRLAVGKYGMQWVLEELAELFDEIGEMCSDEGEEGEAVNGFTRAILFRCLKDLFAKAVDDDEPGEPAPDDGAA